MRLQAQLLVQKSQLSSTTAALVLDLYRWPQSRVAKSDLRTSAVAKLGRARSRSQADSPDPSAAIANSANSGQENGNLDRTSTSSSSSSSRSSQGQSGILRTSSQIGSDSQSDADSDSASSLLASGGAALVPLGRAIYPLRHLPEDRSGIMAELEGELIGSSRGSSEGMPRGSQIVVEVQAWDTAQYSAEQLKAQEPYNDSTGESA